MMLAACHIRNENVRGLFRFLCANSGQVHGAAGNATEVSSGRGTHADVCVFYRQMQDQRRTGT